MVHFVGAGPGAPDLITIRGAELLKKADVIIYAGSLVNPELLNYAKETCTIYNSAEMTLEEVIEVMERSSDKETVRLHTGDPCLYGAIREQMDILDKKKIAYDSTPGVSSFIGAAAALNAEFTLPGVSQTLILTRMAGRTPVPEEESIEKLASHGASMVVFLTSTMLYELSERLIKGGYDPDSPAAIVYRASWPDEKVIRTKVKDIGRAAEENGIDRMALIMVGGFLGDDYDRSKLYDPTFTTKFRKAKESEK
jgi:precorrin-4/cobalt-precorrin-4 C11-methyltransferase